MFKQRKFIFLILASLGIYMIFCGKKFSSKQISKVQQYLKGKYVENMIITDECTNDSYTGDTVYYAFPEGKKEYKFKILYHRPSGEYMMDYYLPNFLKIEMEDIIKDTIHHYFKNATYHVSITYPENPNIVISGPEGLIVELLEFYNVHKRPLSWYDAEHPPYLPGIFIYLYRDKEIDINPSDLSSLAEDLKNTGEKLNVKIEIISFYIYDNLESTTSGVVYQYKLQDGNYSLHQYRLQDGMLAEEIF